MSDVEEKIQTLVACVTFLHVIPVRHACRDLREL